MNDVKMTILVGVALLVIALIGFWVYFAWAATGALMAGGFSSPDFAYYFASAVRCVILFVPLSFIAALVKD